MIFRERRQVDKNKLPEVEYCSLLPIDRLMPREQYASLDDFNIAYQRLRQQEEAWLEDAYPLDTIEGILSIPARKDLPNAPSSFDAIGSCTGHIDYYLHAKAMTCEEDEKYDMALACLKKCNEIRIVTQKGYRKDDYLFYPRLLAFLGRIEEAEAEKTKIDRLFGDYIDDTHVLTWKAAIKARPTPELREKLQKDYESKAAWWESCLSYEYNKGIRYREYDLIKQYCPELCPKSKPAYSRMKHMNSKRYQEICRIMEEHGITLSDHNT